MLGFFSPWALAGLLLLAVPIAVHIFKPRKTVRTVFTNLRWLHESQHKLSRRIQWHQILLFLLRALLLILLVTALARPILNLEGGALQTERFIVLDRSRTMDYDEPGKEKPFARGSAVAGNLLAAGGPGDRSTVILASRTVESLGPLQADHQAYAAAVLSAQPNAQDADLSSALSVVRSMLSERRKDAAVEVFFITNNLDRNWTQSALSNFLSEVGGNVKVTLVDVAPARMSNAWIASASLDPGDTQRPPSIHAEVGWAGDSEIQMPFFVRDLPGLPELSTNVDLKPGQLSPVSIDLPVDYNADGQIARLELRSNDGLPDDDVYLLDLEMRGLTQVLVIEPTVTQVKALQPGLHLRSALQALATVHQGTLDIKTVSPNDLTPDLIAPAQLIFLVEPDVISDANVIALENRVRSGAGLAIFLGPAVNVSFFNDKFYNASNPESSLSPVRLSNIVQSRGDDPGAPLSEIDWRHPILTSLYDPSYGDLPRTHFQSYFQTNDLPLDSPARVVAKIGDSAPALLETEYGAGHVVLFNTTANDAWSDLARRSSFVPLLDRVVSFLSGGFGRGETLIGESVVLPIGDFDILPEVTVTSPSGMALHPSLQRIAGQIVMRLDQVQESGIYTVEIAGSSEKITFVVQASRADSPLARMDPNLLQEWWSPVVVQIVQAENLSREKVLTSGQVLLWPWLVGLACLMMIGEMFLVHWVCPSVHPRRSQSQVSGQGAKRRTESGV